MTSRRRREGLAVLLALGLLLLAALVWWSSQNDTRERRAAALAGLPPFPSQHLPHELPRQPTATAATPSPSPPPAVTDRLGAFALSGGDNVAVLQVNALLNTPFFARLSRCLPAGLGLGDAGAELGLDLQRDVDRVALLPSGLAMSGTFDERLAARLAQRSGTPAHHSYRGAEVYELSGADQGCVAQVGSLVLWGAANGCEALVDRALDAPAPPPERERELDADLYARSDLEALRGTVDSTPQREQLAPLVDSLQAVTLRANVWEDVALSIEGTPAEGKRKQLEALAAIVQLSVAAGQSQLAEDPEWSALLEKAKVDTNGGTLHLDVALPAAQLLEHLRLPCPASDGGL